MRNPLVTISIPTYNSEKYLKLCLEAIQNQTYQNIEVNIIDGHSKDSTLEVAKNAGIRHIYMCDKALLRARYEGIKIANGELTLLLDSDQILEASAIERAVEMVKNNGLDMLALEEDVFKAENWLEKLFQLDRKLVHSVKDLEPQSSVILPRFYYTNLLKKAFKSIPEATLNGVGGQDHSIIYYEVWLLTKNISLLPNAVKHIEPNSIRLMMKKFYRWGYSSGDAHHPRYKALLAGKERFRKGLFTKGQFIASLASITLLILKGLPYFTGYYVKKFKDYFLE